MKSTTFPGEELQKDNGHAWLIVLTLILALAAGLIYGRLTIGHNWGDDFAGYIGQAKSIWEGNIDGYIEQNSLTIRNSRPGLGPVAYPWGYPLMLAAVYPVCGLDIFCLKLLNIPVYLLFLIALFLLLNRHLTKTESLLITGLFAVNPALLEFQDNIWSDIPFMLFSTLAMWLVDRVLSDESSKNNRILEACLGAALFLAFFVRTAGILIVATLFAMQSFQVARHYLESKKFFISPQTLIPYAVFGALYLISNALLPAANGSYLTELNISVKDILYNLWYYQSRAFHFFGNMTSFSPLSWVLLALALTGMLLTFPRNHSFAIYTLATLGLYAVWPFPSPRFLFGIAPFIVYFVYYPIRYGLSRLLISHTVWRIAVPATMLLALGIYFGWHATIIVRNNLVSDRALSIGPFTPESAELFAFIREQTPPDSKIVFFKPRVLSLLTGRTAWEFNQCDSLGGSDFVAVIKNAGFDNHNSDTIKSCDPENNLEIVFENDTFIVYKKNNESAKQDGLHRSQSAVVG